LGTVACDGDFAEVRVGEVPAVGDRRLSYWSRA